MDTGIELIESLGINEKYVYNNKYTLLDLGFPEIIRDASLY
jgi:hypothetical protein